MVLNIVLFEPEIPQNTGNIARTCKATGAKLHLVGPMGFKIDNKKLKRAGLDYWDELDITFYESIAEFYEKNNPLENEMYYLTTKAKKTHCDVRYHDGCYIIFGKETAGIPEEILVKYPDLCLRIPMVKDTRSLNLSNAVAIVAYEVYRQDSFESFNLEGELHRLKW